MNYKWSLFNKQDKTSLVYEALHEMSAMSDTGIDCWLSRVNKMEVLLNLTAPNVNSSINSVQHYYKTKIKSAFDIFYMDQIK